MTVWTLVVEVPDDWGDPDELVELLAEEEVGVRELHYCDMLERRDEVFEPIKLLGP